MNTKVIKENKKVHSKIIGFKELRENADKYINAVGKGREFTIVRRSVPIFKMVPVDGFGDEGKWDTIVNFKDKKGKGITAQDLVTLLKKIK